MDLGEPDLRSADRAAKNNTFMLSRLWRPEFQLQVSGEGPSCHFQVLVTPRTPGLWLSPSSLHSHGCPPLWGHQSWEWGPPDGAVTPS